jgi:hypothetical protein
MLNLAANAASSIFIQQIWSAVPDYRYSVSIIFILELLSTYIRFKYYPMRYILCHLRTGKLAVYSHNVLYYG